MKTLEEAQDYVVGNAEKGVKCPCCGKFCRIYKRTIHSEPAVFLIKLVRMYLRTKDWVPIRSIIKTNSKVSTDGVYLIFWDLLETKSPKRSGLYRPTQKGIDFALNLSRVPKQVFLYNKRILKFSDDEINIIDALGTKFSYAELMK